MLIKNEEAYIVATVEMEIAHGLPKYAIILANEMEQVLRIVSIRNIFDDINSKSAMNYSRKVVEQLNK